MLTFEQKQAIIETFPELTKKEISLKRLNYHFDDSLYEKTIVVEKLHPNGNGFVFVGDLAPYQHLTNDKGLLNIRDFDEVALKEVIAASIKYLAEEEQPIIETWRNSANVDLQLMYENRSWAIYHQENLEEAFGTREAAIAYLDEEGFHQVK